MRGGLNAPKTNTPNMPTFHKRIALKIQPFPKLSFCHLLPRTKVFLPAGKNMVKSLVITPMAKTLTTLVLNLYECRSFKLTMILDECGEVSAKVQQMGYPRAHRHKLVTLRQELVDVFVE